ncbi:MAG: translation initiation factor IF-2 [Schwartzia sp.]|nr:translation initiation factor IF-2 [Schwartzia sp. (in: firmicutes)]
MSKYRVYELAKEFHTESKNVLKLLTQNGYEIKNTLSSVGEEERAVIQRLLGDKGQNGEKGAKPQAKPAAQTTPNSHTPPAQRPGAKPSAQTKPLVMGTVRRIARGADIRAAKEAAERAELEAKEAAARAAKEAAEAATRPKPVEEPKRPERVEEPASKPTEPIESRPQPQPQPQQERPARKPQIAQQPPQAAQKPAQPQAEQRRPAQQGGENRPTGGRNGHMQGAGAGRPQQNAGNSQNQNQGRKNGSGDGNRRGGAGDGGNRRNRDNGGKRGGKNQRDDRRNSNGGNFNNGGFNRNENRPGRKNRKNKNQQPQQQKAEIARPTHIKIGETIVVRDLASKMSCTAADIIKKLFLMGSIATINQEIDYDTAELVASEFGVTVEALPPEIDLTEIPVVEDDPKTLVTRPPVVTVMGHVDHGKTSLLDVIRKSSVARGEAGGITQHIGAYQVNCQGKKIVFLDTPGHEAFTAMRARGAQVTDIAILVVAADDGVMPQTIEAINHAKSAKVPIIVAINKIDKPGANPDHVKQQLAEHELISEEWGGDVIMVPVSAKKEIGINDLLETILLVAEVQELKANPNREARGVIIEAQLDKGRGPVATVLVQNGTLRIGDSIVAGTTYGKVRAMINDRGENVKKAPPSMPVEVLGLSDVPEAGDELAALDEKLARAIAEKRIEKQRTELIHSKKVSLDDLFHQIQEGHIKDLNIVIKADVQGSVEALTGSLLALNKNEEVRVSIVHSGVGAVSESDVMLAAASNALIIAFNVRPDANARKAADAEKIDIRTYQVIYDALNDVKAAMSGMLAPKYKEVVSGKVEIRQVMKFSKVLVAGCYVLEGKIRNDSKVRIIRDHIVVFDGEVDSLRRFKDDVKEVASGYECGLTLKDYRDFKEGDILEVYEMEEIETSIAEVNAAAEEKEN